MTNTQRVFLALLRMTATSWHPVDEIAERAKMELEDVIGALAQLYKQGFIETSEGEFCIRIMRYPLLNERNVLNAMLDYGLTTPEELAGELETPIEVMKTAIRGLQERGLLDAEVPTRQGMRMRKTLSIMHQDTATLVFLIGGLGAASIEDLWGYLWDEVPETVDLYISQLWQHGWVKENEEGKWELTPEGRPQLTLVLESQGIKDNG